MALIKCPECGKEISDKATYCINCGAPNEIKERYFFCETCGSQIKETENAQFCEECGNPIKKDTLAKTAPQIIRVNKQKSIPRIYIVGSLSYLLVIISCFLPYYQMVLPFGKTLNISLANILNISQMKIFTDEALIVIVILFGIIIGIAFLGLLLSLFKVKNSFFVTLPIALLDVILTCLIVLAVYANSQQVTDILSLDFDIGFWILLVGLCGLVYYLFASAESKIHRNKRLINYSIIIIILLSLLLVLYFIFFVPDKSINTIDPNNIVMKIYNKNI